MENRTVHFSVQNMRKWKCLESDIAVVFANHLSAAIFGRKHFHLFMCLCLQRKVDLLLSVEALFMTVGIGLVPWCPTLVIMSSAFFVAGFAQGGISASKIIIIFIIYYYFYLFINHLMDHLEQI